MTPSHTTSNSEQEDNAMTDVDHTPGPFTLASGPDGAFQVEDARGYVLCARNMWPGNADESAANGVLFAVAPQLLAAAQTVLAGLNTRIEAAGSVVPVFDGIADLHDAISKAGAHPMTNLPPVQLSDVLLPCPFCGGELVITKHHKMDAYCAIHRCSVVSVITYDFQPRERIVASWNTRALSVAIVRPLETAPTGDDALEPDEVSVHEGSWAIVTGTNDKPAGWIDTHALFAHQLYRDQILPASPSATGVRVKAGVTEAMVEAAMDRAAWTVKPTTPEYEGGALIDPGMSQEEADHINAQLREEMREILTAALAVHDEGMGDEGK